MLQNSTILIRAIWALRRRRNLQIESNNVAFDSAQLERSSKDTPRACFYAISSYRALHQMEIESQKHYLKVALLDHAVRLIQNKERHLREIGQMRLAQPHELPQAARGCYDDLRLAP